VTTSEQPDRGRRKHRSRDASGYPTVSALHREAERLTGNPEFRVEEIGRSDAGEPIHLVRWGAGRRRVLWAAYPHPNEPIGGRTVLELLRRLEARDPAWATDEFEWNVVPCADPDGARLNESWSRRPFALERFCSGYFRQVERQQVEWSFPLRHGALRHETPSAGTHALMRAFEIVRPHAYLPLHNCPLGGAYFFVDPPLPRALSSRLRRRFAAEGVPLHLGLPELAAAPRLAPAVFGLPSAAAEYDRLVAVGADAASDPSFGGAGSGEYLRSIGSRATFFLSEVPFLVHPASEDLRPTDVRLAVACEANSRWLFELRRRVATTLRPLRGELDEQSPFRPFAEELFQLAEASGSLSGDADAGRRRARRCELFHLDLHRVYAVCWHHQAVRLLLERRAGSPPRTHQVAARRLRSVLLADLRELLRRLDLPDFRPIAPRTQTELQLDAGRLVLAANRSSGGN